MIISSTLVMKTSESSSFLTDVSAHPCVQSDGDNSPAPLLWRSGFGKSYFSSLQLSSDVTSILQCPRG